MWRHLLYLVGTIGVAFLAALLIVLVVEPRLAGSVLSGRTRQISALVSLVLVAGSGYIMFCWLQYTIATYRHLEWVVRLTRSVVDIGTKYRSTSLERQQAKRG